MDSHGVLFLPHLLKLHHCRSQQQLRGSKGRYRCTGSEGASPAHSGGGGRPHRLYQAIQQDQIPQICRC